MRGTISNNEDGDLVDQDGNLYSGTVDGEGVHFTDANGNTSTGTWQRGSADVSFTQSSGALDGFSFNFSSPHFGQDARGSFSFGGSRTQAEAALGAAGLNLVSGGRLGADWLSSGGPNQDNTTHARFNFDWGRPGVKGNVHTGEHYKTHPAHPKEAAINFAETLLFLHLGGTE